MFFFVFFSYASKEVLKISSKLVEEAVEGVIWLVNGEWSGVARIEEEDSK